MRAAKGYDSVKGTGGDERDMRFRSNRKGSAAVEFALVAPLFFALLFAIIETVSAMKSGNGC